MKPIFERAFTDYSAIGETLRKQADRIRERQEKEQVHVRENSPLFFFHPDGADGPRFRIESTGSSSWSIIGTDKPRTFSTAEIGRKISESPECFSASALLRPLVQDSLFPTAAYIGGEAEQRYFEQIVPLFDHFALPVPCLCPRARFLLLEPKAKRLLEELHLNPADVLVPDREFLHTVLSKQSGAFRTPESLHASAKEQLKKLFGTVEEAIREVDQTLLAPLAKTEERFLQQLDSLVERYTRALGSREQLTADRARSVRDLLLPAGREQERTFLAVYFLARYGDAFRTKVLQALEPGAGEPKVVYL